MSQRQQIDKSDQTKEDEHCSPAKQSPRCALKKMVPSNKVAKYAMVVQMDHTGF
jgi:hypothetical protein